MMPAKRLNIYPKSDENITAAIDFYFTESNINRTFALEKIRETSLSLNQIEFLLRKISEAIEPVFAKHLINMELKNLITNGIDALVVGECKSGSLNRKKITQEFKKFSVS